MSICRAQLRNTANVLTLRMSSEQIYVFRSHLAFCVPSRFVSGSVHAWLQVSVCSGYNLCHPG